MLLTFVLTVAVDLTAASSSASCIVILFVKR
jgi:hypothetical protein